MSDPSFFFLFEVLVDSIKNFVNENQRVVIKAEFSDVFDITLRYPKEESSRKDSKNRRKSRRRRKLSDADASETSPESRLEMGQALLFETTINKLKKKMENNPLKLIVQDRQKKLGWTEVPWDSSDIDFLNELQFKKDAKTSILRKTEHKIHNTSTADILICLKITIKISCFKNTILMPRLSLVQDDRESTKESLKSLLVNQKSYVDEEGFLNQLLLDVQKKHTVEEDIKTENVLTLSKQEFYDQPLREVFSKKEASDQVNTTDTQSLILSSNSKNYNTTLSISKDDLKNGTLISTKSASYVCTSNEQLLHHLRSRSIDSTISIHQVSPKNLSSHEIERPSHNTNFFVGYLAVKNPSTKSSNSEDICTEKNTKSTPSYYKFNLCYDSCQNKVNSPESKPESFISLDLPEAARELISVTKCSNILCDHRKYRNLPTEYERILIDLTDKVCEQCFKKKRVLFEEETVNLEDTDEQVEDVKKQDNNLKMLDKEGKGPDTRQMKSLLSSSDNTGSCYCTCQCKVIKPKKNTYCKICRGYEILADSVSDDESAKQNAPSLFPCPYYHKLASRKTSSCGSPKSSRSSRTSKSSRSSRVRRQEILKARNLISFEKYKFKRGFVGIPRNIGKDPNLGKPMRVPKRMGWKWNADTHGLKYRPDWKPGACHRKVVEQLSYAKNPERKYLVKQNKGKQKEKAKEKEQTKKPLLVVTKKNGEFEITLETLKTYNKPRTVNQPPFQEKNPIVFTVGKTAEEKELRRIKKERHAKWLEYAQRVFIQSAFRNMCRMVCHRCYLQAIGMTEDPEDLLMATYEAPPFPCNCSSNDDVSSEDTDYDTWCLKYTSPNTLYKPDYQPPKFHTASKCVQYDYLDYKVNLVDKSGKPVPRFFTGPDGKQECSDLGGFWGPGHVWLKINVDGFIASDGRWAPYVFIGPENTKVHTSDAMFSLSSGEWLVIGVDGYIDAQNKWRFYKNKGKHQPKTDTSKKNGNKKMASPEAVSYTSAVLLNKMGVTGRSNAKTMLSQALQSFGVKNGKSGTGGKKYKTIKIINKSSRDEFKCKHATPSPKGILAIDERGKKIYFTASNNFNKSVSSKERQAELKKQGIILSSYHIPCMRSYENSEKLRQFQLQHILDHNAKVSQFVQTDTLHKNEQRHSDHGH